MQLVNPPQCNFEGVEGLMDGCSAQLQSLSASAAGSVDLPSSLLLNGWLQRYCFTYTSFRTHASVYGYRKACIHVSLALKSAIQSAVHTFAVLFFKPWDTA